MKTLEMSRDKLTCQAERFLLIECILAQTNNIPLKPPWTHDIDKLDKKESLNIK